MPRSVGGALLVALRQHPADGMDRNLPLALKYAQGHHLVHWGTLRDRTTGFAQEDIGLTGRTADSAHAIWLRTRSLGCATGMRTLLSRRVRPDHNPDHGG
ncbi:hypothetical protein GCM10023336_71390 [Streptomyces similanensis]|uniref:Uncharacterized protein n=1 Tax=Streptomyces similanensis TaxID=1274988 RepID=A0ABP9LMF7_9ACTN